MTGRFKEVEYKEKGGEKVRRILELIENQIIENLRIENVEETPREGK